MAMRRLVLVVVVLTCTALLVASIRLGTRSGAPSGLPSLWTLIIPNSYSGMLAIRYSCPGGHRLVRKGTIVTRFSTSGADCVADPNRGWAGQYTALCANGASIPFVDPGAAVNSPDAIFGGNVVGIGGGTASNPGGDIDFAWYYVGPAACIPLIAQTVPTPVRCHYHDPIAFALSRFAARSPNS